MKKMKNIKGFIVKSTLFIMTLLVFYNVSSQNSNPNIVIIYVDDLGFGDIGVNGAIKLLT